MSLNSTSDNQSCEREIYIGLMSGTSIDSLEAAMLFVSTKDHEILRSLALVKWSHMSGQVTKKNYRMDCAILIVVLTMYKAKLKEHSLFLSAVLN